AADAPQDRPAAADTPAAPAPAPAQPADEGQAPDPADGAPAPDEDPDAPVPATGDPDAADASSSKVPLSQIQRYVLVYRAVKEAYVDPVEDEQLMESAIRGLLQDLDPHSSYLDKAAAESFDEQTSGAYEGIGVEPLQQQDRTLKVVAPSGGAPAARAGGLAGAVMVAMDGTPIAQSQGMVPLRGAAGTQVVITLLRQGRERPFHLTLHRETIRVTSVRSRMLE